MSRKSKYPKLDLSGGKHYVYTHTANGMVYVGESGQQPNKRWQKSKYHGKFRKFVDEVGFDNMVHEVVCICDNREDARLLEDSLICMFTEKGVCLNEVRSGGVNSCEEYYKAKVKAYREAHKEEIATKKKAHYEAHKEEFKVRWKAYHEAHRDELKAKNKAYYEAHKSDMIAKQKLRDKSKKIQKNP